MCKNLKLGIPSEKVPVLKLIWFPEKVLQKFHLSSPFLKRIRIHIEGASKVERDETSSFYVKNKASTSMFFLEIHRKISLWDFLSPGQMFQSVKYF